MNSTYSLFLRQSYLDAWDDYKRALSRSDFPVWDYIILTASNEAQAKAYEQQLSLRQAKHLLPSRTTFAVLPDPNGNRVGSGGATLNALRYIRLYESSFRNKRILVIHSGGDSKRVPQYSACGKLFSPVPRELPNGKRSTLFDEFIIGMSGVPSRIKEGMLTLSGDVLLLFNPLQIDAPSSGAAAISFKEDVETGKDHGVFNRDDDGNVGEFLHKQTVETLTSFGAVNEQGKVDIDTGAILFSTDMLGDLYSLIDSQNKFDTFVNDRARLSFYGDFLYPLASHSTLEQFYKEKPEGSYTQELHDCRTEIWNVLHKYNMKLLRLSPAAFIHFGTTRELRSLMTHDVEKFSFLDWKKCVSGDEVRCYNNSAVGQECVARRASNNASAEHDSAVDHSTGNTAAAQTTVSGHATNNSEVEHDSVVYNDTTNSTVAPDSVVDHSIDNTSAHDSVSSYAINNSVIGHESVIGLGCYIEDSYVSGNSVIGSETVLSHVTINDRVVPNDVVMHGLKLQDGRFVVRIYGVNDNPKEDSIFGGTLDCFKIPSATLWNADIYPVCDTIHEAVVAALNVYEIAQGKGDIKSWQNSERMSLCSSFNFADTTSIIEWETHLRKTVKVEKLLSLISNRGTIKEAYDIFRDATISAYQVRLLEEKAEHADAATRMRIYFYLGKILADKKENDTGCVLSHNRCAISDNSRRAIGNDCVRSEDGCVLSDNCRRVTRMLSNNCHVLSECDSKQPHTTIDKPDDSQYDLDGEGYILKAFSVIQNTVLSGVIGLADKAFALKEPVKEEVTVKLPLRVNWGGGWSDTPPYCNEQGGTVLNAAIRLNGQLPVEVQVKKLDKPMVVFESADMGTHGEFTAISELQDCHNPYDPFALHKAALIACGVIPRDGGELSTILETIGGLYLSTQVHDVPKGSGLGTSSVLAGACVKALFTYLGREYCEADLYDHAMCMEQIMSTGGGWQDQIGGMTNGVKYITSAPGIKQNLKVRHVELAATTRAEFDNRFALIYTGQRRLARNLLREVIGRYIGNEPDSIYALEEIQRVAAMMKFELERGNIDGFAKLLNDHWELSKKIDIGSTNTCIDQIFMAVDDLIDGHMICGAGGGGFLQVILKKGVTKRQLRERLHEMFQDCGVDVWDCAIEWE